MKESSFSCASERIAFFCFVSLATIITKMATSQQKEFCVSQFESCKSVVTVQRAFRREFNRDSPKSNNIRRWHNQFATTGCLCKGKSLGLPRVSEENVQCIRDSFLRSLKMSVRKASRELGMPVMTVWKVLWKHWHMHPYHLQLLQALKPADYAVRSNFVLEMLQQQENDDFLDCVQWWINISSKWKSTHTMSESGDLKIPVNSYNLKETSQNLMCFVLFPDERFMDRSFSLKLTNWNDIPGYAPRMALSSTAGWTKLHLATRWHPFTLA